MLNCAIIMGRLTADPELRTTANGHSVTTLRVAVERRFSRNAEERQTDFLDVVVWEKTAEFVTRYFHKGSMIAVQGSIQTRNWEDKNGNKRTSVEIVADNVSFCGSKSESGNANNAAPAARPAPAYQGGNADGFSVLPTSDVDAFPFGGADDDDGLPF